MAINSALARVGVTGVAFVAPKGTTFPAVTTTLPTPGAPFVDLGAISEDGLTEARDEDRTDFTPWQLSSPIRSEVTTTTRTFQATFWETKKETVSLYYQVPTASMSETAAGSGIFTFTEGAKVTPDVRAWIFDIFDGTNQRRFECPLAQVTDRGDIVYSSAELIGYNVTITAYAGTDGVSIRRYFKEGWTLA